MTGIEDEGKTVRLAAHAVELTPEQKRARDALVAHIEQDGFNPPPIKDLDADPALLRALEEEGQLVRIESFFLTRGQADEVRRRVRRRIEEHGPLTVAEIRDLLETSRKYAVPLSEWLDRTGATRRQGDVRRLGPRA